MGQALSTSDIGPSRVGYICAHGTGTPYNDLGEVRAIRAVFGDLAPRIPISSIKSIVGHTNGAAGALASVACVLSLQGQRIPPTATLTEPDPEFGLDFVMGQAREVAFDYCLNLSAGFGGFNACILLGRAP
jgi:3-oxoacyl-[acyl-carrier-protein] synthase II